MKLLHAAEAVPDSAPVFREVAERYAAASPFIRHYVNAKLHMDPIHRAMLALGEQRRFGTVLDIGCGRGQLAVLLLVAGLARHVTGLDRDAAALLAARSAAGGLAFLGVANDLAGDSDGGWPQVDSVLLVDVLYQLDTSAQHRLLARAMRAAGELVVLRTLDPERGLRSRVSLWLENLARGRWPHSSNRVNPRPVSELCDALAGGGFTAEVTPCWAGTPLANVLVVARRTRPV